MSCPHFRISIRQRSHGKSAVGGAAYISGSRLFCEYDQRMKNYTCKQNEVVASGILLPNHAPRAYADRQTLWNAVEKVENQWNAQLSRDFHIAIPREIPPEEREQLIRAFCMQQFVSRGMIADYAIHDKQDGNPHAHIMLTMRAMDEQGRWLPKARKEYELDANGERIMLPSGHYKTHKVYVTDWDDRSNCERWRTAWSDLVNQTFVRLDIDAHLDLRSYERQGITQVPTVHLGPAVTAMERRGIHTELGDYNRKIQQHNSLISRLKGKLSRLLDALREIASYVHDQPEAQPAIIDYLHAFDDMRREGRIKWNQYARQKAGVNDLKFIGRAFTFMHDHDIRTFDDLRNYLGEHQGVIDLIAEKKKAIHKNEISLARIDAVIQLKPIFEKSKKGFEKQRAKYAEAHAQELETYRKAIRYLKANNLTVDQRDEVSEATDQLKAEVMQLEAQLHEVNIDYELIDQILMRVDAVTKAGRMPGEKQSIAQQLQREREHREQSKEKEAEKGRT